MAENKYEFIKNFNTKGLTEEQKANFNKVYGLLLSEGSKYPEADAMQWALETGWGKSNSGKNNLFGIKARAGEKSSLVNTKEDFGGKEKINVKDNFKDYETEEDSIRDRITRGKWKTAADRTNNHSDYIDYLTFINGYATDANYDVTLKQMLKQRMGIDIDVPKADHSENRKESQNARKEEFLARFEESYINNQDQAINSNPGFSPSIEGLNTEAFGYNPIPDRSYEGNKEATNNIDYGFVSGFNPSNINYRPEEVVTEETIKETNQERTEDKAISKTAGTAFNFKGIPILDKKAGLVENKEKAYGGLLSEFNEGGTHEDNPLGGVPQGGGSSVEEGETRYNDYIFSNRFYLSKEDLEEARLDPSYEGLSIAEASKEINKYLNEAPFDKITRDTVKEQLDNLMLINEFYRVEAEKDDILGVSMDPTLPLEEEMLVAQQNQEEQALIEQQALQIANEEQGEFSDPNDNLIPEEELAQQFALGGGLGYQDSVDKAVSAGKFNQFVPTNPSGFSLDSIGGVDGAMGVAQGAMGIVNNFSGSNSTGNVTEDTIGGVTQGASAGAAFGGVGAGIGAVLGGVSGFIGGNKAKKKRLAKEERLRSGAYNDKFIGEDINFQMADGGFKPKGISKDSYTKVLKDQILSDALKNVPSYTPQLGSIEDMLKGIEYDEDKKVEVKEPIKPGSNNSTTNTKQVIEEPMTSKKKYSFSPSEDMNTNWTPSGTIKYVTDVNNTGTNTTTTNNQTNGFVPKNDVFGQILSASPIAGSVMNVLDPVKANKVGYQTSTFKYQPSRIDENSILNNIRQEGSNVLRSLEQSGMSSGQMASAKLATSANNMRAMSDAQLRVNEINNAEKAMAQQYEYQVNQSNIDTINRQIEDNLAAESMADMQNRQYKTDMFNNMGAYGNQRLNENAIFNASRGYTSQGIKKGNEGRMRSYADGGNIQEKFFPKSEEYLILEQILNNKF